MKRFVALITALMLVLMNCGAALAVDVGSTVTATVKEQYDQNGNPIGQYDYVDFGDGFYGFCLDKSKAPAYNGDEFTISAVDGSALDNMGDEYLSNKLKLLLTENFATLYANDPVYYTNPWNVDANGDLQMLSKYRGSFQSAVWHLTDGYPIPETSNRD